ncbi:hypothetical protein QYE76_034288 [Lolium multiflorum]|uniref:Uncharacterized protein n=1 Tax=Lolium multiflorum TaxID=4521 RepID=A0AAD8QYB8_LOLMU|nr:hypothetical protein QYE76_034288 [Lolium multiflorum]
MQEGRRKNAKDKAELSRAAKRRAIEGVLEEQIMEFSDVASDDCKELSDSGDDDGAVDVKSVSITKRKSRSKKIVKKTYYDESNPIAHELFQIKLCFVDVHQYRRALRNYHIVNQRDFEYLRNDHDRSNRRLPEYMDRHLLQCLRRHHHYKDRHLHHNNKYPQLHHGQLHLHHDQLDVHHGQLHLNDIDKCITPSPGSTVTSQQVTYMDNRRRKTIIIDGCISGSCFCMCNETLKMELSANVYMFLF